MWRFVAIALVGCSFQPGARAQPDGASVADGPNIDAPPPVTCGDLTCDPHATCHISGTASCSCGAGYTGNGMTCQDVDECASANGNCPAACANTDGSFQCYAPQTCAAIEAVQPGGGDGNVTLYVAGDPAKPWTAFCSGGLEYLTLPAGAAENYAQYTARAGQGTDVRTTFSRIRLIPSTLMVDISDQKFATSTGQLTHPSMPPVTVTSMPYAIAMDCVANNSQTGVANIDLTGTPFVVTDLFELGGFKAAGTKAPSNGGRIVALTGGGFCGWSAPAPAPSNPFNAIPSAPILDLAYSP